MLIRILCLLLLVELVASRARFVDPVIKAWNRQKLEQRDADDHPNATYYWDTHYFNVKVDHFTYSDTRTYPMKWLLNNTYYKPGGPIFFYTGNEGDIEGFAVATGIMWDLAPLFSASIIFAEHRYYGNGSSMPFGNASYSDIQHMGYLTSEQALGDYAAFLTQLKTPNNGMEASFDPSTPVVAFGGSYGGMLAAWFRMKYPHLVVGAWASSAPLLYVENGGIDQGVFDSITTRTFNDSGCNNYIIENVWNATYRLASTQDGRNFLNTHFIFNGTGIQSLADADNLNAFLREAYEYMAMVDYAYPTSFLEPMPGYPVQVACQRMNTPGTNFTDEQLVTMAVAGASVYYNWTGETPAYCIDYSQCGDQGTSSLGSGDTQYGWPWQECTEIVMDMCAKGMPNDFFWNECQDNSTLLLIDQCVGIFGSFGWTTDVWNMRAVEILYGLSMEAASNIILTQGHLDPWSGGGYKDGLRGASQSRGIYALEIPGSAHHLDLRQPNKCDPNTISNIRFQIVGIIRCWIDPKCTQSPQLTPLPPLQPKTVPDEQCFDDINGYPWGQTTSSASSLITIFAILTALIFSA